MWRPPSGATRGQSNGRPPTASRESRPMNRIQFDEAAFRREIGQQLDTAMKDMARDLTREMDTFRAQYQHRTLPEIKAGLQQLYRKNDGSITEPELTEYAEMIKAGTRVAFTPGEVKL